MTHGQKKKKNSTNFPSQIPSPTKGNQEKMGDSLFPIRLENYKV